VKREVKKEEKKEKHQLLRISKKERMRESERGGSSQLTAQRHIDGKLRQFLGSSLDPGRYGPMHVALNGYDPADWTAADATLLEGPVAPGVYWAGVGMTQSNVALCSGASVAPANVPLEVYNAVDYQLPTLGSGMHKVALRTLIMKIDMDVSVSSKGRVFFGVMPVQETFGSFSGIPIGPTEVAYFKSMKSVTFSEIAAKGGLTIPWHRLSPLADQYKDPSPMSLVASSDAVRKYQSRKRFAPYTAVDPTIYSKSVNGKSLPGAVGDGYLPTLDCMVPVVLILNEEDIGSTPVQIRVQVIRTWDVLFQLGDSEMVPVASGSRAAPPIPESVASKGNTILKHFPGVFTRDVSQVVDTLATYGKEAVAWSQSPNGRETIDTALKVLGTGVSVGSALLPFII